jgi:Aminotransferase class-III
MKRTHVESYKQGPTFTPVEKAQGSISADTTDTAWHELSNAVHPPIGEGPNVYLERQAAWESNARTYPRRIPIAIKNAKGVQVTDTEGRTYFDCLAGAGALALGHNHPVVVQAIQQMLAEGLPMQTLDLTTPVKDQFVQTLFASLPAEFSSNARVQFCGPSRCGRGGDQARQDCDRTAQRARLPRGLPWHDSWCAGFDC